VHSQIDENLPSFLVGDPVKLGQVITNLIGNAIKFTHKGAVTLRLWVREMSGQRVSVDFSVTDTGIGIPKEKQEHIFEEFSQGGYDINQKYGGTGLGLTISRKLLELHGSRLQLKSEPGQGSVFYFNLTLKAGKEEAEQKEYGTDDTHTKTQSLQGVKILIVEDNEVNVMVLGQFLSKWGATYERVENGQQAIDKVTSGDYDLVMMDLQMPEMDGYQASSHIRRLKGEKYQAIPIIALSAFAKNEIEALLQEAGINDFVSKPFNPKELFSKIASYTTDKKDTSLSDQKAVVSHISGNDSPAGASFNLSEYKKITSNNAELTHLLKLSIRDLMLFKHESADVLQKREKGLLEKMVHKNRTIITLLEAKKLQALVAESVLLLEHGDDSSIQKTIQALHHELDFVINGLTQHLAL
jgi:CheY-like chemotaxis protein